MEIICWMRQVSATYAQHLLHKPDEVIQYIEAADDGDLVETSPGEDLYLEKAWHGLHYLLTGTAWGGIEPCYYLLSGGEHVGNKQNHAVGNGPARILLPDQVRAFHKALAELSAEEITARFNPTEMGELHIYPEIWEEDDEQTIDWLRESFTDLQDFVQRVAQQEGAVLINLEEVADLRPAPGPQRRA